MSKLWGGRFTKQTDQLVEEYGKTEHGLSIREIAGGYKMATKAEHHEAVRAFVKKTQNTPRAEIELALQRAKDVT